MEFRLLAVGLIALAFGAGAVGWVIGHATRSGIAVMQKDTRLEEGGSSPAEGTPTSAPAPKGSPVAGKKVFVNAGCGSCHTLAATGASGTVGPSLDQVELSASEILDWVAKGKGGMPSFKGRLSEKQLADLVAFLAK